MQHSSFEIPAEFRSEVRYVDSLDGRSDEEILASLCENVPIKSEKNIWTFWHSGVHALPGWCQRNITNWVRLCGSSWTIRVLDNVSGSANHALKWIDPSYLPETFLNGTMDGPYVGPHSADFLRGAALHEYGGVWMDVGIILFRDMDRVCWNRLEDPQSPFTISVPWMYGTVMANHFVASRKGDPFIKRWHDVFVALWKGRTNPGGIITHPLVQFAKNLSFEQSKSRNFKWDFKVTPVTVFEYIGQVLAWQRVAMIEDPTDGFDGREYWTQKVLLFDSLTEDWGAEDTIGFEGSDFFDALATKRDTDTDSKQYRQAYKVIWRLLTRSSMQKITHGKNLTTQEALGIILDKKENQGLDVTPGTFFELLRYGSVHFEQTREQIDYVEAKKPTEVIKESLLNP